MLGLGNKYIVDGSDCLRREGGRLMKKYLDFDKIRLTMGW